MIADLMIVGGTAVAFAALESSVKALCRRRLREMNEKGSGSR